MTIRLVLMASGRGSNVESILEAVRGGQIDADPLAIVSNNAEAGVIDVAKRFGLPCHVVPHDGLSRQAHEEKIIEIIDPLEPDYIALAGYMRIFSPRFIYAFNRPESFRIINIHPSLLPDFAGSDGYGDAFRAGVKTSGVTVHFVDDGVDTGPIIAQAYFQREEDDTLETFKARGLAVEHQLYPKTLGELSKGLIQSEVDFSTGEIRVVRDAQPVNPATYGGTYL